MVRSDSSFERADRGFLEDLGRDKASFVVQRATATNQIRRKEEKVSRESSIQCGMILGVERALYFSVASLDPRARDNDVMVRYPQ